MRTSVFFTSELYTSLPTMGQNGTLLPNSCAIPSASAVLPVPGAPVIKRARPAIFFSRIMSTTTPHASRAFSCPIHPAAVSAASPSSFKPKPYTTNEPIARALVLVSHSLVVIARRSRRSSRGHDASNRNNQSINQSQSDESFIRSLRAPFVSRASHLDVRVRGDARLARQARHLVDLHPIDRLARLPLARLPLGR